MWLEVNRVRELSIVASLLVVGLLKAVSGWWKEAGRQHCTGQASVEVQPYKFANWSRCYEPSQNKGGVGVSGTLTLDLQEIHGTL